MFWVVCRETKDAKVKKLTCSSSFLTLCEQARPGFARAHHPRCPAAARDPLPKTRLKVRATAGPSDFPSSQLPPDASCPHCRHFVALVSPLSRVYGSPAVVLSYNLALLALRLVLFLPTLRRTTALITYISQPPYTFLDLISCLGFSYHRCPIAARPASSSLTLALIVCYVRITVFLPFPPFRVYFYLTFLLLPSFILYPLPFIPSFIPPYIYIWTFFQKNMVRSIG